MNRRELLTVLAGAAVGAAVHVESVMDTATADLENVPVPVHVPEGWADNRLQAGDIFTVSGYYAVNPSGTKELQRFVVTNEPIDPSYS